MIAKFAKTLLASIGLELRRNPLLRGNRLRDFSVPLSDWQMTANGYYLNLFDVTVPDRRSPLLTGYGHAKRIARNGGRFFYDGEQRLRLEINGIQFYINFTDELFVINEVFASGEYNFNSPGEFVVVDIGLNIGATSLFFSQRGNVRKIYAYELFRETFQTALKNFSLNNATKIVPFNVGLGSGNKEMTLAYSPLNKARMGFHGLPTDETFTDAVQERVVIKDVAEEFRAIAQKEPGSRKLCKMDCEGAEFEILKRLFDDQSIGLMDIYIIEWHDHDPVEVVQNFIQNGFEVIKNTSAADITGIIYAMKTAKSINP